MRSQSVLSLLDSLHMCFLKKAVQAGLQLGQPMQAAARIIGPITVHIHTVHQCVDSGRLVRECWGGLLNKYWWCAGTVVPGPLGSTLFLLFQKHSVQLLLPELSEPASVGCTPCCWMAQLPVNMPGRKDGNMMDTGHVHKPHGTKRMPPVR